MGHRHTVLTADDGPRRVRCETPDADCADLAIENEAAGLMGRAEELLGTVGVQIESSDVAAVADATKGKR